MDKLLADVMSSDDLLREARSALPNAPVVSDGREQHKAPHAPIAARPRTALAHGLERLAAAVAPRPHTA